MKILLSGTSGFIGRTLAEKMIKDYEINYIWRNDISDFNRKSYKGNHFIVGNFNGNNNWKKSLVNIDCVIHSAGLTTARHIKKNNIENYFNLINYEATKNFAKQASENGVKRFIFISSVAVNSIESKISNSLKSHDHILQKDFYGNSKLLAENALWEIQDRSGMEITIIRPPAVYGPNVKGNFLTLLKLISIGVPLPFLRYGSPRSYIGLDNLIDLIICCLKHPKAKNQIFLASDDNDISLSDLVCLLSKSMNKSPRLFSLPNFLIKNVANVSGYSDQFKNLTEPLRIDLSKTKKLLNWSPVLDLNEGLNKMTNWYLNR